MKFCANEGNQMQFDKEVNLKIIHALKPFVTRELRGLEAWKELHNRLTPNVREIRRISPKLLKMHVMKSLIFEIKRNKFKLPQNEVEILCYPFLATLVGLKLMILDNQRYPTIASNKLERQRVFVKYLLSRTTFNRDLWNLVHKFAEEHPAEYHYININNPQYGLTEKEKAYLRKFACKTTPDKSSARKIERVAKPNKWLGKKKSPKKSEPSECVVLNGMLLVERLQEDCRKVLLLQSPKKEPPSPQTDSEKENDADEAHGSENEQTQLITGLSLAEDLVAMDVKGEKGTASVAPIFEEERETIELSSGSETNESGLKIPFSFYDSSDTSDVEKNVIYTA